MHFPLLFRIQICVIPQPVPEQYEQMLQDALNEQDDDDDDYSAPAAAPKPSASMATSSSSSSSSSPSSASSSTLADATPSGSNAPAAGEPSSSDTFASALDRAEAVENRLLSVGPISWVAPLRHKRRLFAEGKTGAAAATPAPVPSSSSSSSSPASSASFAVTQAVSPLSCVRISPLDRISEYLQANAQKKFGLPTAIAVHSKIVAVGTSRGYILVFDHFQTLLTTLSDATTLTFGACTALDVTMEGDHLIAGHSAGHWAVWDLLKKVAVIKPVESVHQHPVSCIRMVARSGIKFISADIKGNVYLVDVTRGTFFSSYSFEHSCLFDQKAGALLTMQVLVPPTPPNLDQLKTSLGAVAAAFSSSSSGDAGGLGAGSGSVSGSGNLTPWASVVLTAAVDLATAFASASARWEAMQLTALANPKMIMIASLAPTPKVLFRLPRPVESMARAGTLPQLRYCTAQCTAALSRSELNNMHEINSKQIFFGLTISGMLLFLPIHNFD